MTNKELPPKLTDTLEAIRQFTENSQDAGMGTIYFSIEFDPKTGEPRQTVMKATNSKDSLTGK